jgi:hypothetical protein
VVSYAVPGTARIRRLGEDLLANATNSSTAGLRRTVHSNRYHAGSHVSSQKRTVLRPLFSWNRNGPGENAPVRLGRSRSTMRLSINAYRSNHSLTRWRSAGARVLRFGNTAQVRIGLFQKDSVRRDSPRSASARLLCIRATRKQVHRVAEPPSWRLPWRTRNQGKSLPGADWRPWRLALHQIVHSSLANS